MIFPAGAVSRGSRFDSPLQDQRLQTGVYCRRDKDFVAESTRPQGRNHFIKPVQIQYCGRCNEPVLPHRVCPNCGYYQNREVVAMEEEGK